MSAARYESPATPVPVDGCVTCERLLYDQTRARRSGDGAAETDARVLLRRHLADQHPA
jgi:hypothetical protein